MTRLILSTSYHETINIEERAIECARKAFVASIQAPCIPYDGVQLDASAYGFDAMSSPSPRVSGSLMASERYPLVPGFGIQR